MAILIREFDFGIQGNIFRVVFFFFFFATLSKHSKWQVKKRLIELISSWIINIFDDDFIPSSFMCLRSDTSSNEIVLSGRITSLSISPGELILNGSFPSALVRSIDGCTCVHLHCTLKIENLML